MPIEAINTHGTCVAFKGQAVLLRGEPGAGKSDLALRLIEAPYKSWQLVSDDRVLLQRRGSQLWAMPPPAIAGKLEVRGIGIVDVAFVENVPLVLIAQLVKAEQVPRLPAEPLPKECLAGLFLPVFKLDPFASSAPLKLRLALERWAR